MRFVRKNEFTDFDFGNEKLELFANLCACSSTIDRMVYPIFKKLGLSRAQFFILGAIATDTRKKLSFTELSKFFQVSRANISGILARLEKSDLIRRTFDQKDKRVNYAALTSKSKKIFATVKSEFENQIETLFPAFPPEDVTRLLRMLIQLRKTLSND